MSHTVALARIVPVKIEGSGVPFASVVGCRNVSDIAEAATAQPLTSSRASTSGGRVLPRESLPEEETKFELKDGAIFETREPDDETIFELEDGAVLEILGLVEVADFETFALVDGT